MEETIVKCSEKGCEFTAEHKKSSVAKRMLGIHKRRAHGILGKSAYYAKMVKEKKEKLKAKASTNGHNNRMMLVRSTVPIREQDLAPTYTPERPGELDEEVEAAVDNMERAMLGRLLEKYPCCPCCGNNNARYLTQMLAEIKHELSMQ